MSFKERSAIQSTALVLASLGLVLFSQVGIETVVSAQNIRSQQWYLDSMHADDIWKVSTGKGVTVAVVDHGVDPSLPELDGQVLDGTDVSPKPIGAHRDDEGHGSNMAAIIAGTANGGGIQGLAPGVKILPVKVPPPEDSLNTDSSTAKGIRYAADNHAQVINISMGSPSSAADATQTRSAVEYALKEGSLIFAATGNSGEKDNVPSYPSDMPGVVGVAAVDREGSVTKFSTYGPQVALAAYGDHIAEHCSKNRDRFCFGRGTSQATAIASASAALIWSKHPDWTNNQVLRVMMQTAGKPTEGDIPSKYIGYGGVRPRKVLVDGEGNPGPPDVNPLLAAEGATTKLSAKPSSPPSTPSGESTEAAQHGPAVAEPNPSHTKDRTMTWIGIGAGAAVLAAAAIAFVIVRQRGKRKPAPQPFLGPVPPPPPGDPWRH